MVETYAETKDQRGLPEVLSCGGHFRQRDYEDRRDKTSLETEVKKALTI